MQVKLIFASCFLSSAKDNISDSGIEASGELGRSQRASSSEGDLSPTSLDSDLGSPHSLTKPHDPTVPYSTTTTTTTTGITTATTESHDSVTTSRAHDPLDEEPELQDSSEQCREDEEDGLDSEERLQVQANGSVKSEEMRTVEEEEEEEREEELEEEGKGGDNTPVSWSFPPLLEEFDLITSDVDPCQLEEIFADDR